MHFSRRLLVQGFPSLAFHDRSRGPAWLSRLFFESRITAGFKKRERSLKNAAMINYTIPLDAPLPAYEC